MGKRIKKGAKKNQIRNYKSGVIYVCNIGFNQVMNLYKQLEFQAGKEICENLMVTGICLLMFAQISISARPEDATYVESLESVKDLKQKILNGNIGLNVAACIGMSLAFPYAMDALTSDEDGNIGENLATITEELTSSHTTNTKRIIPSTKEWLLYARGEMGSAKGQMISCPSTNLAILNIDAAEAVDYTLGTAIEKVGIDGTTLFNYGINKETISNKLKKLLLTDKKGFPIEKITYQEPNHIKSKIQEEIMGGTIIREQAIKTKLEKGQEPQSAINKAFLSKHLSKNELFAYEIAISTGDKQMAKKLTNKAMERSKGETIS